MNLTTFAIEKRTVTYFAALVLVLAGIASFFRLGQLEDPEFTIKTAVITTAYPGATPEEVELEVTDRIEKAMQQLEELDHLESVSRAGVSTVKVDIKPSYWSDELQQVWDKVRRKVNDVRASLPPGAGEPTVNDDFGDVFGLLLAITSDGYTYAELEDYAEDLRRELSLVPGVAKVEFWGVQRKVIYVDVAQTQLTQLGLGSASIQTTLSQQNMVVDAGHADVQTQRLRIAPTGAFRTPEDIADLAIRPSVLDAVLAQATRGGAGSGDELIRIGDIATVSRGYADPPRTLMRFNGERAIGLAISNASGVNVVDVGFAVDARLNELLVDLPVGIELHRIHWQSDVIAESVNGFFINLIEAVAIVLVVLALAMGVRMGVIIGSALLLTILATLVIMAVMGIDLQRMSLGALVIALGMMVDNATVVAVMAFYPIYSSPEDVGEYCESLFLVVAISLLVSWVISVTVTPLQCIDMLPDPKKTGDEDAYGSRFYRTFRGVLQGAIRVRFLTIGGIVGLLVISGVGFGNVKQLFFPDSAMPKFMVDYWAPEGIRIQDVSADVQRIESRLLADERVSGVAAFVGAGPPRFYLPVEPEAQNPAYAQLIVNVTDVADIRDMERELNDWFLSAFSQAQIFVRVYGVGPSNTWKLEARFSGPSEADPGVLRGLADQALGRLVANPLVGNMETDWRQRVQKIVPVYNQERGRWSGISRDDIAQTTKRAYEGRVVGQFREGDDLIPIVLRNVEEERQRISGLDVLEVRPLAATDDVPLSQVVDDVRVEWEDPIIVRRDRRRTITVQANPITGVTLPTVMATAKGEIEAIELPPGYVMEWGGETKSSADAQKSLIPGIVPAVGIMLLIIVGLFNAVRPPLVIVLVVPFVLIGMVAGLLGTNTPFGFMALLGAMSLAGMMIKNAIVLLDEINLNRAKGIEPYEATVLSALSRLRPVMLAAATTVLGVTPLLQDVFWIGMAVTIMAGLAFGTVLTMILVPVLYATLFRLSTPGGQPAAPSAQPAE